MAKIQEDFLELDDILHGPAALEARQFVTFSLALQRYVHSLIDDLHDSGFSSIEVLEKSQMLLKSVMPDLSIDKFHMLLDILKNSDKEMEYSLLYNGLLSLRSMIANDIASNPNLFPIFEKSNDKITSLFAGYVTSTVCSHLENARKSILSGALELDEVRHIIDKTFDISVEDALITVPMIANKLN
ncbi:MAG: hypothetical protein ACK5WS_07220 [Alphaproteobacteria bacterium]|nr:hypothetical protein [Candidatus Jidaibacter sp.]